MLFKLTLGRKANASCIDDDDDEGCNFSNCWHMRRSYDKMEITEKSNGFVNCVPFQNGGFSTGKKMLPG